MPPPIYLRGPDHPQAAACARCEVRQAALFGALDDAGLMQIHTRIETVQLEPGAFVYSHGSSAPAVYTVREGMVRFERGHDRGERRTVRLAGRGDLFGLEALLQRPHADTAVACTRVQLCRIPIELIQQLGREQGALPLELMQRWQQALEATEAWVAELSTGAARRRLLQLLLHLADYADETGRFWMPRREEIGAMLDLTTETASRQVSVLRREGVLVVLPGWSARVDVEALRRRLQAEQAA